ncbi:hypothetical protein AMECASPLE_028540 [Ameca splendens]|uniref:Uncharacterized protein n=1 Tax=Ameca splendens TaxID=208324 RepID=A0ABV1AEG1_9TELE
MPNITVSDRTHSTAIWTTRMTKTLRSSCSSTRDPPPSPVITLSCQTLRLATAFVRNDRNHLAKLPQSYQLQTKYSLCARARCERSFSGAFKVMMSSPRSAPPPLTAGEYRSKPGHR